MPKFFPEIWVFPSEKLIAQAFLVAANSRESQKLGHNLFVFISYKKNFIEIQGTALWPVLHCGSKRSRSRYCLTGAIVSASLLPDIWAFLGLRKYGEVLPLVSLLAYMHLGDFH